MDIYKQLRDLLQHEYARGATDQEIADRLGCSGQQINRLRNGKRSFAKMRLETVLKLFPKLSIALDGIPIHGAAVTAITNGNGNIVAGRDAHAYAGRCTDEIEAFRSGLMQGLIDIELDDSAKVQMLRFIRDFSK
ncbi:MAG: helix-turn-helix transcriptional regulator [Lentisphaeria bacterium]|nr:helix-turn-helix transcriptional regulator [Lentisphaeria bacterium]